jgi:hypothetical protein
MLALVACGESRPDWPEAEPAASTCRYTTTAYDDEYLSESTIYYDERHLVQRVDGFAFDEDRVRAPYYFEWDNEGRLLRQVVLGFEETVVYEPARVVVTRTQSDDTYTETYDLVDGRVATVHTSANETVGHIEYDAAGRPTVWGGWQLTYDESGRVMTMRSVGGLTVDVTYTENETESVLDVVQSMGSELVARDRFTFEYDDERRVTRMTRGGIDGFPFEEVLDYVYGPDRIDEHRTGQHSWTTTGIGDCPAIRVNSFGPTSLLPVLWSAERIGHRDPQFPYDAIIGHSGEDGPDRWRGD